MNTIKIDKKHSKMVAHAGLGGLEMGNTNAGFIAAGNRSYYGIETDVHVTKDKKIVVVHDDTMERISGINMVVEESTLEELQRIPLFDMPFHHGMEREDLNMVEKQRRSDLRVPVLSEYIRICKRYEKTAVLELKNKMEASDIANIIEQFRQQNYLEHVIFISFCWDNLVEVRKIEPGQTVQLLTGEDTVFSEELVNRVAENHFDLDIHIFTITKELVDRLHAKGIKINCWTVDWPDKAEMIAQWGVDYITSNILE